MKLYATVTSERASKGQGGNEFIVVELKDEFGKIGSLTLTPDIIATKLELRTYGNPYIEQMIPRSTYRQEKECPTCGESDGHHTDDACEPYKGDDETKGEELTPEQFSRKYCEYYSVHEKYPCGKCGGCSKNWNKLRATKGEKQKGEPIPFGSPQYKRLRKTDEGNW